LHKHAHLEDLKEEETSEECTRAGGGELISGRWRHGNNRWREKLELLHIFGVLQSTVVNNLCPVRISGLLLLLLLLFVGLCIFSHSAAFIIRSGRKGMIIKEREGRENGVEHTHNTQKMRNKELQQSTGR
jgi:hypothetical protein